MGSRAQGRSPEEGGAVPAVASTAAVGALAIHAGAHAFGQVTFSGLVSGSYYALAAVGLTLMTAMLRVVNFAYGDIITVAAFVALGVHAELGLPMVAAAFAAAATGAVICLGIEFAAVASDATEASRKCAADDAHDDRPRIRTP